MTKGAVYHHFRDKAELFEAAFVEMEERLLDRVIAGVEGSTDPWELMAAGIDIFLAGVLGARFPAHRPGGGAGGTRAGPGGRRSRRGTSSVLVTASLEAMAGRG